MEESTARTRLGVLASTTYKGSPYPVTPGFRPHAQGWEDAARAVAAEVLRDPVAWARDLGLPEPPTAADPPAGVG